MKPWNRIASGLRRISPATVAAVALLTWSVAALARDGDRDGTNERGPGHPPAPPVLGLLPGYTQINLVADVPGLGTNTDANLVNPWGLVIGREGTLIVADNHSGLATFYGPDGTPLDMTVAVDDDPTGVTVNHSRENFLITDGTNSRPARLLFATESGKILAWNQDVDQGNAVVVADNSSSEAIYKGIALGHTHRGAMLYATDFHNAKVDMFDSTFKWIGSFTDPNVDAGFAPFNVQNIGGWLFVTFAKQLGPDNEDDEAGPGNGFIDIFRPDGRLARRFGSHGPLDSPWGMAVAPRRFGRFGGALLIGNFGDGRINAYNLRTGAFLGSLADSQSVPIQIEGLWALQFGHDFDRGREDGEGDRHNPLYFTAGPGDESHGLLGLILPTGRLHY
jgi:uncharacterized protein (TIGR03118 family)